MRADKATCANVAKLFQQQTDCEVEAIAGPGCMVSLRPKGTVLHREKVNLGCAIVNPNLSLPEQFAAECRRVGDLWYRLAGEKPNLQYLVVTWKCGHTWKPSHPLDLPPALLPGAFLEEIQYQDEPVFRTRKECIAQAANDNRELVTGQFDVAYLAIVVEIMQPEIYWAKIREPLVDGAIGMLSLDNLPFRLVVPTAEEIRRHRS